MAVDIDSLQIEIEATSSDAAQKINQLVTALSDLKLAAKGGAGLTTTTKQLQALSNAAKLINSTNLNSAKLKEFASAMNSLATIQKASGLNSTINSLKKLPEISESLEKADIGKFAKQMNQVADAMRPLATEMQKVSSGFSAFPIRIQKIIQSNSGLTASNKKTAKSFSLLNAGINLYILQRVADVMSDWVVSANEYIENINLFQVSMGEFYEEAFAYAQLLNDRMGIDPSEWMRNQGVFMSMANGFGLAREQAYALSEGLTELSYDLSSLYNEDVEQSALRLQSALAGEIEPIRRLGISISQATLQEYALARGIDESVTAMTEQEKALLRSLVLMEGAARVGAIGDFAKTLESPANAMRILRQQITQLGRALGTVLLPIIVQIIPWVQAFVSVLTDAISALATLVGFTMPEWDTNDWSEGLTSGAIDAEDAIDGVSGAAKELKRALLGIDELTILEPSNSGGAGSGIGPSWTSGIEIPDIWDKNAISQIQTQTDQLKDAAKDLLYNYILPIGTALAGWKIVNLLSNLGAATSLIAGLKKALIGGVVAYLEFRLVQGSFDNFLSEDGSIWDFVKGAIYTAIGSGILYAVFGPAGLVVGLGVSIVATLSSLTSSIGSGLDYKGFESNITKLFIVALGGIAGAFIGGPAGAAIGILLTAGIVLSVTNVAAELSGQVRSSGKEAVTNTIVSGVAGGLAGAGIGLMVGGPAGAVIGFVIGAGITIVGQDLAVDFGRWYQETSKIVDGIEILDDSISDATKNSVGPFLEQMQDLDDMMTGLEFNGTVIDASVISDVESKVNTIVSTITNGLDGKKNSALSTLEPLQGLIDQDTYAEILAANSSYYEQAKANVQAGEFEISQIMQTALENNGMLQESSWLRIAEIQAEMQDLGVENLSQTEIEYETIMRNLRDNTAHISLEQASEIIKNAQATRDESIAAAETQYSTILLEAQKMLDMGVINSEQYQTIMDAAKEAKDSTIADATEQYQSIYDTAYAKLGDLARYIDENTGEIKSKWTVFWEDVSTGWNTLWDNVGNAWDNFKAKVGSAWTSFWTGLGKTVAGVINGIISAVESGINWVIKKLNSLSFKVPDWIPVVGGNVFGFNIPELKLGRVSFVQEYALGGFPEHGEMFIARENGPEMVGRIGNRTAVANNDQIVNGIASANDGVINAIYAMAQRIVTAIEENSGDIYVESDGTATQNRRNRMYGKTLQYI